MAGAAAPVMLLPLRLAALMGREKSNTTQISVDSSALGQQPVLMSSIFVTITRHTDILSPALLDRLQPLAITIVRRRASRVCRLSHACAAGQRLQHAQRSGVLRAGKASRHSIF